MDKLLTAKETAKLLHISRCTLYRYSERGLIPHYKTRFGLRFEKKYLDDFLSKHKREAFLVENILNRTLTSLTPRVINNAKGGNSKLAKKGQTCFNYGFGSVYSRKTKTGIPRWYICYYDAKGKRIRKVVPGAQSKEHALLSLRNESIKEFSKKNGVELKQKKKIGFSSFAQIYLNDYIAVNRRNYQSDVIRLEKSKQFFKETELRKVTLLMIERFRKSRLLAGNTKSTCNRYLALLKRMFNLAKEEAFVDQNPVCKIKFFSENDTVMERILTYEEEKRLIDTSSEPLKPFLTIALNTGMRPSEILNLKWNQIDLKKMNMRVEKTKSGKVRYIPINTPLLRVLLQIRSHKSKSPFLFFNPKTGKPITSFKKAFKAACRRADIEGLRIYDCRHTFASRLIQRGVDIETVRSLLGHHSIKVTERYTHSNHEIKRKAVDSLNGITEEESKKTDALTHLRHMEKEDPKEQIFKRLPSRLLSWN